MPVLRTFLDSSVLIAAFRGQHNCHVSAREIIDDPDREFLVSDLLRLEVLPKAMYYKNTDEVAFYETVFSSATQSAVTNETTIARAFELAKKFGLSGFDACLADAAITLDAAEFVTGEAVTKAFFRITGTGTKFISIAQSNPAAS